MNMRHLTVALLTLFSISSCTKDTCNVPNAFNYDPDGESSENCIYGTTDFKMKVVPYFGDKAMEKDAVYTTEDGREISFSYFGMYLSELSLQLADGAVAPKLDVMLTTMEDNDLETTVFPKGEVTGLNFTVGVDSSVYHIDPATYSENHPLASKLPTMYWSWATGYRYISIEGMVDTSAAGGAGVNKSFQYHIGLDANLVKSSLSSSVINTANQNVVIDLKVDIAKLLENVDFTSEHTTHTFNDPELAAKISANAEASISKL